MNHCKHQYKLQCKLVTEDIIAITCFILISFQFPSIFSEICAVNPVITNPKHFTKKETTYIYNLILIRCARVHQTIKNNVSVNDLFVCVCV